MAIISDHEEQEDGSGREEERDGDEEIPTTESIRRLALRTALEKLKCMCTVLGVDYKKKLFEMGVISDEDLDVSRVYDQMHFLQVTIDENYKKFKVLGRKLMMEWELSETPFRRMMQFAHVISVSDSTASADITDAFFLSTMWLKKAQKELDCLQKERKNQSKKEYENQKKKLKEICFESHITLESVSFDPTRKVNPEKYNEETIEIRKKIEKARDLSSGRKELVFRVELVRQLIEQRKLPVYTIRGFLELAKKHVEEVTRDAPLQYDGDDVSALLDVFKVALEGLEDEQKMQQEEDLRMQKTRTRYARSQDSSNDEGNV